MLSMQEWLAVLVLSFLAGAGPAGGGQASRRARQGAEQGVAGRVACPKLRFRRRGCQYKYECKEVCKEKKKCKTTYQYKASTINVL